MAQVSVTINDRIYRLVCNDGEEERLVELATYVKSKVADLTAEIGHAGDERLMLMAALMIADELWDARASGTAKPLAAATAQAEPEPLRRLKTLAAKMGAAVESGPEAAKTGPASPPTVAAPLPMPPPTPSLRRRDVA